MLKSKASLKFISRLLDLNFKIFLVLFIFYHNLYLFIDNFIHLPIIKGPAEKLSAKRPLILDYF